MTASTLVEVTASDAERAGGEWLPGKLRAIVDGIRTDGIVVLHGLIDPEHLDQLNEFMVQDAQRIAKYERRNFGTGNIQQSPPLQFADMLYDDVFFNALLLEAVAQVLGPQCKLDFISGNTALAETTRSQPVHSDLRASHIKQATYYLVANIPLITSSVETGATEVWPGTHVLRSEDYIDDKGEGAQVRLDQVEARRAHVPPLQPTVPKGSIILRDLALWHRGRPNPSPHTRCMMAFGFGAKWYRNKTYFKVPDQAVADLFAAKLAPAHIEARPVVAAHNYNEEKDRYDFTHSELPVA